jgi:antitoxin component HigA of HigAB toxin-antitoxin module
MDIRPIHTEADYKLALKVISELMETDPDLGTPEGDRLDILTTLVQAYEASELGHPRQRVDRRDGRGMTRPTKTNGSAPCES